MPPDMIDDELAAALAAGFERNAVPKERQAAILGWANESLLYSAMLENARKGFADIGMNDAGEITFRITAGGREFVERELLPQVKDPHD